jgi:hypothetical protein
MTTKKKADDSFPLGRLSAEERLVIEMYRCSSVKVRAALMTLMHECEGSAFGAVDKGDA